MTTLYPECICQAACRRWASRAFPYPLFWKQPATRSKLAFCNLNAAQRCYKFYCSRAPKKRWQDQKKTNKTNSLIKGKKRKKLASDRMEWTNFLKKKKKRTTQITKPGRASKQLVKTPSAALDGQPPTPSSLSPTPHTPNQILPRRADITQMRHRLPTPRTWPPRPPPLFSIPSTSGRGSGIKLGSGRLEYNIGDY